MRMKACVATTAALLLGACSDGAAVADWRAVTDDPDAASPPGRFLADEDGLEARPGPNACLWRADLSAACDFRLSVAVTHLDSGLHPHGAGLTFGGQDVDGANPRYSYFLVRGDRKFLIKTRAGAGSPDLVPWTEHAAAAAEDERGVTHNRLAVEARGDDVRFLLNGTEVHRCRRQDLPVDGRYGYRLVHDIHVKFGQPLLERLD